MFSLSLTPASLACRLSSSRFPALSVSSHMPSVLLPALPKQETCWVATDLERFSEHGIQSQAVFDRRNQLSHFIKPDYRFDYRSGKERHPSHPAWHERRAASSCVRTK